MREHIIFNEILKSLSINCPFIKIASDISINRESWQETEVGRFLTRDFDTNSLASLTPAVISFAKLGV